MLLYHLTWLKLKEFRRIGENKMSLLLQKYECAYCFQNRRKSGVFRIFGDTIKFFCSNRCLKNEITRLKKRKCNNCGKSFNNYNSVKDRKYCSKKCSRAVQSDWYDIYNWCDCCNAWIPKEESKLVPAGSILAAHRYLYKRKKDHYFCPKCNNELRTSKKYKKN